LPSDLAITERQNNARESWTLWHRCLKIFVAAMVGTSTCAFAEQAKAKVSSNHIQQNQARKPVRKHPNPVKPEASTSANPPTNDQDLSLPEDIFQARRKSLSIDPTGEPASFYRKKVDDFTQGKSKSLPGYDSRK